MAAKKYYVVWVGRKPGVYANWAECQEQVNKFEDAKFKSYATLKEAEEAYKAGWKKSLGQGGASKPGGGSGAAEAAASAGNAKPASWRTPGKPFPKRRQAAADDADEEIDYNSISVDVGTNGNPGPVEYKGVDTRTGEVVFSHGPIAKGTNNLGEFLAIVHGLAYLEKHGLDKIIYSDSLNAIKWVRQKAVASTLKRDSSTKEIWELVDRAVKWLQTRNPDTRGRLRKWQTHKWGEIKADYGRK